MDSMSNPGEESTDYTVYTSPGLSMPSTGYPSLLFCPACKARRLAQHESVLRPTKSSHKWPTWVWRSSSGVYGFSVILNPVNDDYWVGITRDSQKVRKIGKIDGKVVTKRSREDPLVLGVVKHFGWAVLGLSFGGLRSTVALPPKSCFHVTPGS